MPNIIPRVDQLIGQVIDDGRLCLVDPLGNGSGGVVFRAIDLCTSTPYAVKCMVKAEPGTRQSNFQKREIRLHSLVSSHPSVVTLHRVIEEDGYIFLVLDYCPGGDLFKFLTQRGTFVRNDAVVRDAMCQLIDGLEHCHKSGVYHRDIKPENILCSKDGTQLKLGDFGLASDSVCSKNFGAGTSGYMSPECIGTEMGRVGYHTGANDIWSLGIIFTSMISGHNPWRRAVMTDDCFRSYIGNPNFFRLMLPISPAADDILRSIFAPSEVRISLSDLRRKIVEADTFFLTDDQIAHSSKFVQLAAASYLCECTAPESKESSFEAIPDRDVEELAQRIGDGEDTKALSEPALQGSGRRTPGSGGLQVNGVRSGLRKRPVPPPPQPMPSFRDFVQSSTNSSQSDSRSKSKSPRAPHSPVGFLKRMMDKIFVD